MLYVVCYRLHSKLRKNVLAHTEFYTGQITNTCYTYAVLQIGQISYQNFNCNMSDRK